MKTIRIPRQNSDTACWEGEIDDLGSFAKNLGAAARKAHLEGAHLEGAYLEGADLEGADLKWADLKEAHLEGADLEGADLKGAHLEGAHLKGADLEGAHLEGAHLKGADLEGADLKGACLDDDAKIARMDVCEWPVTIQFNGVHVGCKTFSVVEILAMTEDIAATHHAKAPIRWRRWGKALQALAVATLGEPEATP